MAIQELEWHAVDDVDFDDREADILENVHVHAFVLSVTKRKKVFVNKRDKA